MFGIFFSPSRFVFDLVYGLLFGNDRSNGFAIFDFNAYICFFITVVIMLAWPLIISPIVNHQPPPVFIPVSERRTAPVSSHHHKTTQTISAHHTSKTNHAAAKTHKSSVKHTP